MKEGVDWLAPSAFTSPITATYTRDISDIISNAPALMFLLCFCYVFACTLLHLQL